MNEATARALTGWLTTLPAVVSAAAITAECDAELRRVILYGARYTTRNSYTASMTAVTRGQVVAGTTYDETQYIFLGQRPFVKRSKQEQSAVFRIGDDAADWYTAFYMDTVPPEFAKYHPYGPTWGLCRWDHEKLGCYIDDDELAAGKRKTRRERIPLRVLQYA